MEIREIMDFVKLNFADSDYEEFGNTKQLEEMLKELSGERFNDGQDSVLLR